MAASEKFCLRWNDFESNISVAFRELREEKDFFDVTLACEDSQVQAHKVILSACSPFFRSVLRRNPHQHPLLYLRGIKYQQIIAVLDFMYQGEVNIAQEELNSFLAVAEELKVKGLTQNTPKVGRKEVETKVVDVKKVKEEGSEGVEENVAAANIGEKHDAIKVKKKESVINSLLEGKVVQLKNLMWKCSICEFTRKSKYDVFRHAEQHLNLKLQCPKCGSIFTRRDKLIAHLKKLHGVTS